MKKWEGEIISEVFYKEDTRYGVYSVWPTDGDIFDAPYEKVVGVFSTRPQIGVTYEFEGFPAVYKGQNQLDITEGSCSAKISGSKAVTVAYLESLPFVGTKAELLYDTYGDDVYDIILEDPERVAKEIKGLGEQAVQRIQKELETEIKHKEVIGKLLQMGLTKRRALKLIDEYGGIIAQHIEENPYFLAMNVSGFSFKQSDVIAYKIGFDLTSEKRFEAGVHYLLKLRENDGDTVVDFNYLTKLNLKEILDAPEYDIYFSEQEMVSGIVKMLESGELVELSPFCITTAKKLEMAHQLVTKLNNLTEYKKSNISEKEIARRIEDFEYNHQIKFTKKQREFLERYLADETGLYLVTGIPGSGKTFVIKAAMEMTKDRYWRLGAPTGRAAKRLGDVTGLKDESQTIHKMLSYSPQTGFSRAILEGDDFVFDETSMVDLYLGSALFTALPNGKKVILLGDEDQLESVGPGRFLGDIIESNKAYHIHFSEPMRQQEHSHLYEVIKIVNSKQVPENFEKEGECHGYFSEDEEYIYNSLTKILDKHEIELETSQMIAPQKNGILGINNLNLKLQKYYLGYTKDNEPKVLSKYVGDEELYFRIGDKVINTSNSYKVPLQVGGKYGKYTESMETTNIFNGDIGEIVYIDKRTKSIFVHFEDKGVIDFRYNKSDLSHAYCLTVHKFQGSEIEDILFIPPKFIHPNLATNKIVYTALSRARRRILTAGSFETFKRMIINISHTERNTMLKDLLLGNITYEEAKEFKNG